MAKLPHIEVVLPVYNEEKNIPILFSRIASVQNAMKDKATMSYLFINDGSSDNTRAILDELNKTRPDVRVIHLLHNFGHSAALSAGIDHFQGDAALLMDADLQDPPEALPEMFEAWQKGAPTVVAERKSRREKTQLLFKLFYFFFHQFAKSVPPISFGTHSLLDKSVMVRLRDLKEKNRYLPGLVAFGSKEIRAVQVDRHTREHGKSRVGFFGLINLAITAFVSFSNTPVRLVSFFGLFASSVSILSGITILYLKLFTEKAIPGWASTMVAISFGMGIQLLCTGIIGEYVARIYEEVKGRPLYLVETLLDKKTASLSKAA